MAKGTVIKNFTNVKTMDGSNLPSPLAMQIDDWVFGAISTTGTDIVNFDHFYRKNGSKVVLPKLCKASVGNMKVDPNAIEDAPPPVELPPPSTVDEVVITESFIYYTLNGIPMSQRMIPDGPATAR